MRGPLAASSCQSRRGIARGERHYFASLGRNYEQEFDAGTSRRLSCCMDAAVAGEVWISRVQNDSSATFDRQQWSFREVADWLGRQQNDGRSSGAARCLRGCPMTK